MAKLKKEKQFYQGVFSLSHQIVIDYIWAYSEHQAKAQMLRRIAKKHDVPYNYIFGMFNGNTDNYKIEPTKYERRLMF